MLKKLTFLLAVPIVLSGCIGSMFVDDADTDATFPNIHDVPERPTFPKRSQDELSKEEFSKKKDEALTENEALRQKHGL